MKSLTFRKVDGVFVAEFAATNNFNLHIEGVAEGNVRLYQRGVSGGDYSLVRGLPTYPSYGKIFDCDFTSPVWPKYLKVECATEPVSGYVTESTAVPGGGGGGSDVVVLNQTKSVSITENGSVSVTADEGFTGLDRVDVDVNVEHVVSNQEKTVDIVANGTTDIVPDAGYDGLGKVSVKVNVPTSGGGGVAPAVYESDVNFRDYDGTLLHSYTKDEFLALSAMPELPTREGLICQEWNWDFAEAQDYVNDYGILEVGATYITDDGKTRLYIHIPANGRNDVPLCFGQTVSNGVTIDWGDGSALQTVSGTANIITHHYDTFGDYCITLDVIEGCSLTLGGGSNGYCIMNSTENTNRVYCGMLRKVEVGNGVTSINAYTFNYCVSLSSVIIPKGVTTIESNAFAYCSALSSVIIPKGVKSIPYRLFYFVYSLSSVIMPKGVTSIGEGAFYYCYALSSVVIPDSVTSIGSKAFDYCYSLYSVVIPNSVTSVGSYAFDYCYSLSSVVLSNRVTSIGSKIFQNCQSLSSVVIPDSVTSIGDYAFASCYPLPAVVFPKGLSSIAAYAFSKCYCVALYDFSQLASIPALANTNAFSNIPSDCKIVVPDALYDEWIAATNWSTYASYIVKASQYYGGSTITFTIDGVEYQATEGMTWLEWCESEYNTEGWYADEWCVLLDVVIGENEWEYSEWKVIAVNGLEGNDIPGTEVIESGKAYLTYTNSNGVGGLA